MTHPLEQASFSPTTRIRAIIRGGPDGTRPDRQSQAPTLASNPAKPSLPRAAIRSFPRGLKVGTIESVAPDRDRQIYTLIRVHPAVNLAQLEEVLIITGTQPQLPAQAQQDLATGEATALDIKADAKRAAELAAERLPSLTPPPNADGTPAAPTPAADAAHPSPAPKTIPILHSDRYSPGLTPPASSLTPGGNNPNPVAESSPHQSFESPSTPDSSDTNATPTPKPKKPAASPADPAATPKKPKATTTPAAPTPKEPQR